jgi:alkylhydroperoxidase family enzyme
VDRRGAHRGARTASSGGAVARRYGRELEGRAALRRRHWNEGEIVEITMVIGLFAYFNRFNDALRVEVTR